MTQIVAQMLLLMILPLSLLAIDEVKSHPSLQRQPSISQGPQNPQSPPKSGEDWQQDEPIQLESNLVNVVFSVADRENRFVTDLKKEEVVLLDGDTKQPIAFFGRSRELPLVLALVVDFSGSQEFIWPQERDAAQTFFNEIFRPGHDYVAVASFRNTLQLHTGLTSQRERLDRVFKTLLRIDTGSARQGTALYDAIFTTIDEVLDGKTAQRILKQNHLIPRRALIVLTDGRDTTSLRAPAATTDRAHRALVTIYAIGIGDDFRFSGVNQAALGGLCRETGGRDYYPRDPHELRWAFKEIAEELTSQYVAGFYPSETIRDGSFREIRLEIPGRKDLTIRYRRGYFAKAGQQ
ncbi:MAG: VWA domain-containing protein [Acidobacteria bacterium]|nr:VWA domain-containing protein [Acidobacteriota bacterium]